MAVSPKPDWFEGAAKARRHEATGVAGINRYQGTGWIEKLDDKELHGVAWWLVRSGVETIGFFLHTSAGVNATLTRIYLQI